MSELKLFEEAVRLFKDNVPFAMATVVESNGSSPRKSGAKMLVRSDRSTLGTVGGGAVELEVIDAALAAIAQGRPQNLHLALTEKYGHVCGGSLTVYIEPLGIRPRVLIFGAGHVGRALTTAAKFAGFGVIVSDERAEYATKELLPDADEILIGEGGKSLLGLRADSETYIVITTPSYESDFDLVRAALKTPAGYIGVIGSKRKREVLMKTLTEEGYSRDDLSRLTIPIGLAIGAESPEEIAISVVSQLIEKRSKGGNKIVSDSPGRRTVTPDGDNKTAASG
ncbi:MAG: XdhC family protein [Syntrophales bacterium]